MGNRRSRQRTFTLASLLILTSSAAIVLTGYRYWTGPTLEERLWIAACAGDSRTFAWLVWLGADVGSSTNGYSPSPIQEAAYQGRLVAVRLYAQHGAYLDYMEKDGFTPINYAAMESHWDVVEFLFHAGANPNIPDATGHTAVDFAREAKRNETVELLSQASNVRERQKQVAGP